MVETWTSLWTFLHLWCFYIWNRWSTHCPTVLACQGCHNKTPQTGWVKQKKYLFSLFWRLEVQDWGVDGLVSSEAFSLGLQTVTYCCFLTWYRPSVCVSVPMPFSYVLFSPGLYCVITMTPFNLNYLFKGPVSKYSHIPRNVGLRLQHVNFGRGHNSAHNSYVY